MKTRTKLGAFIATAVLAVGLAGCATGGSPENDDRAGNISDKLYERSITLKDGREVTCVLYSQGNRGGLSCDWDELEER